ncbi:AAA family ATPase [Aquimarina sp. 2201CG14-23]|uniref:AAA family ATPase n=1 Tax=Aquimarina mycalae TaxID=3040073 RepID=UPI002477D314|nr:AAA family ATPase [Aquimarina sp. 2201CG14-23]MDH7448029.1 hypothetical protein [Aquimarina sp. 2201CG14-23]
MIHQDHYINIPSLSKIKVSNYSLFKKDWKYKFSKGTNVFIGANGLGKTTSTSLIIYAIVGYTANIDSSEFKIDNDYFSSRSDNKNSEDAEIEISFKIKEHLFLIRRKLYLDNKSFYSLDGKEKDINLYEDDLVKLSKLSISDLAFILEKFLIREEEGNYLLWNFRDQSKLLQLLINPVGFKKVYEEKSLELSKLTSEINRKRDTDIQAYNKRIDEIQDLRNKDKYTDNREKVLEKISTLHKTLEKKNTQKKKKLEQYKETLKVFSGLKQNIEKINFDIEIKSEEILSMEQTFYETVYSDKKVLNTIHKMRNYGICAYCDSRLKPNIKSKILEKMDNGNCPVCEEKVSNRKHKDDTSNSINYVQTLESEIKTLIARKIKIEEQKEPNSNKIQLLDSDIKMEILAKLTHLILRK